MYRLFVLMTMTAGLFASGCSNPVRVTRDFDLHVPWEDYEHIEVFTRNGELDLRVADVDDVTITGEVSAGGLTYDAAHKHLDQVEVVAKPATGATQTLLVRLEYPPHLHNKNVGGSIRVRVPSACSARLETRNGGIVVADMCDEVIADTANGRVRVSDVTGSVTVDTSNGAVTLENIQGNVSADTANGRIVAMNIVGDCALETSNGSIRAHVAPAAEGRLVARSSNGTIHLTLPADLGADLRLSTSNGQVHVDLPAGVFAIERLRKNSLRGAMNGGGCLIEARTSNGTVRVDAEE